MSRGMVVTFVNLIFVFVLLGLILQEFKVLLVHWRLA